jgi:hypothetical protein
VSTSTATLFLGYGQQITLNGSNDVTAYSPATYMYAAIDTSNNIHVYGLNLTSTTTPSATQIGSLSLPLTAGAAVDTVICDSREASTNLFDASTVFVVLHIAGSTGCNTTGDVWEVVHYTDASSTAPTVVAIKSTFFTPLYDSTGALTGLELFDATSGNLYLYASDTFTSPTTLVAGVTAASTVLNAESVNGGAFTGNELFLSVTTAAGNYLYRLVHGATTATREYTATGTLTGVGVGDGVNLYFNDTVTAATSTTTFWAEPVAGGTPTELYTVSYPAGVSYDLLGANTSVLVFYSSTVSGSGISSTLLNVPVSTLSATATTIGGPYAGSISSSNSFLQPVTGGDPSTDLVFLNVLNATSGGGGGTTISYSSEVLTPTGTVKKALTSNSAFIFNATSILSGSALQITGITDTNGGYGGGTFNAVNVATLASIALTTTGGAAYTVPAGFVSGFAQLSDTIGAGLFAPAGGSSAASMGGAFDLSKDLIVPISLTNTNVTLF